MKNNMLSMPRSHALLSRPRAASLLTLVLILFHCAAIEFASADEYVRCGTGANSLCRADYPICCDGFCASPGSKCCSNVHTCDPGQECCTKYDAFSNPVPTCCDVGSYCGVGGCIPDICSTITDPGVCVSQANTSAPDSSAAPSLCSWCCEAQRCVPTAQATAVCVSPISNPKQICEDSCSLYGTCDECTLANACLWDSSTQRCFLSGVVADNVGVAYNPYAVVANRDQCGSILYWGHGINPSEGPLSSLIGSSRVIMIIFGVLFLTCLLGICISGARLAFLVNRTSQDWEDHHEEVAQTISAAVPRYGFAVDEEDDDSDEGDKKVKDGSSSNKKKSVAAQKKKKKHAPEKNFRTPLAHHKGSNNKNKKGEATIDYEDDTICHVCQRPMAHESRRRFVENHPSSLAPPPSEGKEEEAAAATSTTEDATSSNKKDEEKPSTATTTTAATTATAAAPWDQLVLLPCYHRMCKRCVFERAEANAAREFEEDNRRRAGLLGSLVGSFLGGIKSRMGGSHAPPPPPPSSSATTASTETTRSSNEKSMIVMEGDCGPTLHITTDSSTSNSNKKTHFSSSTSASAAAATAHAHTAATSRYVRSILDVPDVPEEALLGVLAGDTVANYVDGKREEAARRKRREERAAARAARRRNRSNSGGRRQQGGNGGSGNGGGGDAAADPLYSGGSDASSSNDSSSEDDHRAPTSRNNRGTDRNRSKKSHPRAKRVAVCPICDCDVEVVFVPGKVLR